MPRHWIGILGFLLVFAGELRAQGEIVLSVGSDSVERGAWIEAFRRSPLFRRGASEEVQKGAVDRRLSVGKDSALLREWLAHWIDHKLKVCAAREAGVDTLPAFRQSWKWVAARLRKSYEVDSLREEAALRRWYFRSEQRSKNNGWVRVAHLTRYLPQQGGPEQEKRARALMDSLYAAIQQGADFAELARRYSDDRATAEQGGVLPWMPISKQMQEWTHQLEGLARNQVSPPFYSPLGIHMIQWLDRKEGLSWEECRAHGLEYRERHGLTERREASAWAQSGWKWAVQRAYEALLVAYAEQGNLWGLPPASDRDLKRFFQQHRDRYAWSLPHFRGAVIEGTDKKSVKRLRKHLKKLPYPLWKNAVRAWKATHVSDSSLQVTLGLFPIGSQPIVDQRVYRCGTWTADPRRPIVQVLGKKLKNGPESWQDVEKAVRKDYQRNQKADWLRSLRQKYKVEINEEVLKTVNIDGIR